MRPVAAVRQLTATLLLAGICTDVFGAGFAIQEQSASSLGNAFAGGAAIAQDATTTFFNPAGLTRLPANQLVAGVHFIRPQLKFSNNGTVNLLGQPVVSGSSGGDAGSTIPVPDFYYAHRLDGHTVVAIAVNAPFGLKTEYDAGWVGRYQAIKSELRTVNINPSIGYQVDHHLSIGAGIDAQYIKADLTQAVDYGGACVAQLIQAGQSPGAAGATCASFGLVPQHSDGTASISGNDWSYGFNVGLLYELDAATRFGVAYRSKVGHTVTGSASFTNAPAIFTAKGVFVPTAVHAGITLPDILSVSAYHDLDSRWALMGDVTWTHWSRFQQLRVDYASSQSPSITDENWKNTLRYSLGANYRYNSRWLLRGGIAYDQTPIPDAQHRTPRIPGNNRTWLALGFRYQASPALALDAGYAHLFISSTAIDHQDIHAGQPGGGGTVVGSYDSSVDIVSAQATWSF
ncbi:MAG: outer membrane protein transport protein [Gammaproteobacteria bacterium]